MRVWVRVRVREPAGGSAAGGAAGRAEGGQAERRGAARRPCGRGVASGAQRPAGLAARGARGVSGVAGQAAPCRSRAAGGVPLARTRPRCTSRPRPPPRQARRGLRAARRPSTCACSRGGQLGQQGRGEGRAPAHAAGAGSRGSRAGETAQHGQPTPGALERGPGRKGREEGRPRRVKGRARPRGGGARAGPQHAGRPMRKARHPGCAVPCQP